MSDGAVVCPGCEACRCGRRQHDADEIATLRRERDEARARAPRTVEELATFTREWLHKAGCLTPAEAETIRRERDEARARLNITREIVAEMKEDAVRPKGGQSVSPRRMPVALSVVKELERALGDNQGGYSAAEYAKEVAARGAAERERDEARERARRAEADLRALGEACFDFNSKRTGAAYDRMMMLAGAAARALLTDDAPPEPETRPEPVCVCGHGKHVHIFGCHASIGPADNAWCECSEWRPVASRDPEER